MTHLLPGVRLVLTISFAVPLFALPATGQTIPVTSVHIKLLNQIDVPARQPGVLEEVFVTDGDAVDAGTLLAQIEDDEAEVVFRRAGLELEIERQKAQDTFELRSFEKEYEVAARDLQRAQESVSRFKNSVSKADLDRYALQHEKAALAVEQARFDLELAKLTVDVRANEVAAARQKLEHHAIAAPLKGSVIEVIRQAGEWVEPGETVFRMIRVDRLRAEGFVRAADVKGELRGAPVTLLVDTLDGRRVKFPGKVQFVDAEVDPVNGEIRIWAEVENQTGELKPGLKAEMNIHLQ